MMAVVGAFSHFSNKLRSSSVKGLNEMEKGRKVGACRDL